MKLFYEYMVIFFNLSPTSSHLHPLQAENCGSNSRLVVGEDDNGKFRLERVENPIKHKQVVLRHNISQVADVFLWYNMYTVHRVYVLLI